jgi:hypothetical protein
MFYPGGGHYVTSRKVASSISNEVNGFFFDWPNPFSSTVINSAADRNEYQESSWG